MPELDRGRFRGALLGLACGDALGVSVDTAPRNSFPPLSGLQGSGPHALDAGRWSGGTSMALCLAESLIHCQGVDAEDQMHRYLAWYRRGVWSSKGYCFDIDSGTRQVLEEFEKTGHALAANGNPGSTGNESLMRLAPVALFFAADAGLAIAAARASSAFTHPGPACLDACDTFCGLLVGALNGQPVDLVSYKQLSEGEVPVGESALECLQAALWCVANTSDYETCVLQAANLGGAATGRAAIAGQLAGGLYGVRAIPLAWREKLYRAAEIAALADRLHQCAARLQL